MGRQFLDIRAEHLDIQAIQGRTVVEIEYRRAEYLQLQQQRCKEGPYQDRPLLCPFRLSPLLTCSGSALAFLKIQGPKSKNIENVILLQP